MRLQSFKAQGFKNFRSPVVLEDLGPINVIHGPNNVGKSNLLQAIGLFFKLIGLDLQVGAHRSLPMQFIRQITDEEFAAFGFIRADLFNLEAPGPILLEAVLVTSPEELQQAGIQPGSLPLERVRIAISLRWMMSYVDYTIVHFETADGKDYVPLNKIIEEVTYLLSFGKLVSMAARISTHPGPRFALITVNRYPEGTVALALYDAKESPDMELSRRWDRFTEVMDEFKDILGEGKFVVTYDRRSGQATIFHQTARARIPLRLLGSGVQQLAALLGSVLMIGASIAAIEEPELNLRYTLQLRLREVLKKIVGGPGGLDQLFITSHSDAFEAGPHFYLMSATPDGPRVEKRPAEEARVALGITTEGSLPETNAVLCYLSTEGVVRVPERIRHVIGLPQGGGVIFLARDGAAEMMSDKTFADRFEPKRQDEGDDDA